MAMVCRQRVPLTVALLVGICGHSTQADMPPRPTIQRLECQDPAYPDKSGYSPVCAPGYFRCCATCKGATCWSEEGLEISWRGIRECVKCKAGDYCDGCDNFQRCPKSDRSGSPGPKISPPGSIRPQDCEICATGLEADIERRRCVQKYSDVCESRFVGRCMRQCEAEDPSRGKQLTPCEKMKCQMYCAKDWSPDCLSAMEKQCRYLVGGPGEYDLFAEEEEWLYGCDVDCSSAVTTKLPGVALLAFTLVLLHRALTVNFL
mmetsp:Transcript_40596/g.71428  ORF Transcript_40596/g.71428 Transcript_40596/m.71428 type:complete len:261 (-) Transcript_40596:61-843(-)